MGGVNGTLTFPVSASSGVVSGMQEGRQYQFSVTVALKVNGELFIGTQQSVITQIDVCNAVRASTEISSSALSITGWILFAVTLIVSIILMVCLVLVLRRHYSEKQ